jgi:ABC-2 type transport system permease protein
MSQVDESLEGFKYLSLNSLFDTNAILNDGSYLTQFIALAVVGVVLYGIGMRIFMEKDLPL